MLVTIKVLKRKDASSVFVAVALATIFAMWAPAMVGKLSGWLAGVSDGQYMSYGMPGADWQTAYLQPTIMALLQLVLLEVVLWLYIFLKGTVKK